MTAAFEAEVRFALPDVEAFRARVLALGGALVEEYAFTDHCYRPRVGPWDFASRTLRMRVHARPVERAEVLFSAVDVRRAGTFAFKRSRLAAGKATLFSGDPAACAEFLAELGFTPWFDVIKTDCAMWEVPDWGMVVAERVRGAAASATADLGWMSEIEVDGADAEGARDAIAAKLAFLGVDPATVTASPLPVLVAEALGFVRASGAPPRVYFCGSIRGGRQLQPRYAAMIAWLQGRGYEVLTAHVGRADVLTFERATRVTDRAIYEGDMARIEQADLVVADVTVPSLGVGMELMRADDLGKPILCLCEETTSLSSLVSGHPRAAVVRYRDDEDALRALSRAVEAHGSPASTRPAAEMRGEA